MGLERCGEDWPGMDRHGLERNGALISVFLISTGKAGIGSARKG